MKQFCSIIIDVSNICKYCGHPLNEQTHCCTHCRNGASQMDIIAEKALWSENCFSTNFHKDYQPNIPLRKELPYSTLKQIKCIQGTTYKNLTQVCYTYCNSYDGEIEYYCGYIDNLRNIVIPLIYSYLGNINDTKIIPACYQGKYGVINIDNQTVIPFEYNYISDFKEGLAQYKQNENKGYINTQGEKCITLSPLCAYYDDFNNGMAIIGEVEYAKEIDYGKLAKSIRYGFINKQGETIIQCQYEQAEAFDTKGEARVRKNMVGWITINLCNQQIIHDHEQTITVPQAYYYAEKCIDGIMKVAAMQKGELKYGCYSVSKQKEIIPTIYDSTQIQLIKSGYILIKADPREQYWTYIYDSATGAQWNCPKYCTSIQLIDNTPFIKIKTDKCYRCGISLYQNSILTEIIPLQYDEIGRAERIHWGNYWPYRHNESWGILNDQTGEIILPPIFQTIFLFQDDIAYVKQDGLCGAIRVTDSTIISPFKKYEDWQYREEIQRIRHPHPQKALMNMSALNWKVHEYNGKKGVISDITGEEIIPSNYDRIYFSYSHPYNGAEGDYPVLILSQIHTKPCYGLIDSFSGRSLTSFIYDEIRAFANEFAIVKFNGKYGYINTNGDEICPLIYDDVQPFSEGMAAVKKKGVWGYINNLGQEVISPKYDLAEPFINGRALVGIECEEYCGERYIDTQGEVIGLW